MLLTFAFACFMILKLYAAWEVGHPPRALPAPAPAATVIVEERGDLPRLQADLDRQTKQLELEQKALDSRAQQIDKRADDLEHLITEMIVGNGLYTLLLGLLTAFGLNNARAEADRSLGSLEKQIAKFKADAELDLNKAREERREFRADIPSLFGMQQALNALLFRIRRKVDMSEVWTHSDPYLKMSEDQKQELMLAEMTLAAFEYFSHEGSEAQCATVAEIMASFANFYSARARVDSGKYDMADMRRALIYIQRANDMDKSNARIFAQRAAFTLSNISKAGEPVSRTQIKEAERYLERCLELNPRDVRGLYNLAWIADELGKYDEAARLLKKVVIQRDKLPAVERGRRMIKVFINRACANARLCPTIADRNKRKGMREEIYQDCRNVYDEAVKFRHIDTATASLARELGPGGTLMCVSDQRHYNLLRDLRKLQRQLESDA
ncbi:tetratricopeptide repeat protein [Silvibacterium sp.]|uniref:tetratricopeptide repeat protein n=1 Tax=Silvibacterium sp. TaxID=1964179 RepID=UPI0039E711C9